MNVWKFPKTEHEARNSCKCLGAISEFTHSHTSISRTDKLPQSFAVFTAGVSSLLQGIHQKKIFDSEVRGGLSQKEGDRKENRETIKTERAETEKNTNSGEWISPAIPEFILIVLLSVL